MRRFPGRALIPVIMAAIVLSFPAVSQAQFYWNWGWGWTPSYYSTYYTPSYSTYYTPSYTTNYSASYGLDCCDPCCDPCDPCCPSGSCGLQTARYASSSACCDPCDPCCTTCCRPCRDGCPDGCDLGSSSSSSGNQNRGTTVQPRSDSTGSGGRTPTFVEEEENRGGSGSNYEQDQGGSGDGFQPRNSRDRDTGEPDPLDQNFGTQAAGGREELRFKIPAKQPENRKNPTRRVKKQRQPDYPVLKLDEKITSRSQPRRTRLMERRSWQQPVVAKNVRRESRDGNQGWVPVPLPATQLVKK